MAMKNSFVIVLMMVLNCNVLVAMKRPIIQPVRELLKNRLLKLLDKVTFEDFCKEIILLKKIDENIVNSTIDSNDCTLLHHIVLKKPIEYIRFLLDSGANINALSKFGTPI